MKDGNIIKCYKIENYVYDTTFYPTGLEDLVLTYITLYCLTMKELSPESAFWVNTKHARATLIDYIAKKSGKRLNDHRISKLLDSLKQKEFLTQDNKAVYKNNGEKFYIYKRL